MSQAVVKETVPGLEELLLRDTQLNLSNLLLEQCNHLLISGLRCLLLGLLEFFPQLFQLVILR